MSTQRRFTPEEAKKKYSALPNEVRELLYSTELTNLIQKIGEKNKLHFDQMGLLELEVSNALLGFTEIQDFIPIIMESLKLDKNPAEVVGQDVNTMILARVRNAMKKTDETHAPMPTSTPVSPIAQNEDIPPPPKGALGSVPAIEATPAKTTSALNRPTLQQADIILSQPTVSKPAQTPIPPAPKSYTTDPYREPPTP